MVLAGGDHGGKVMVIFLLFRGWVERMGGDGGIRLRCFRVRVLKRFIKRERGRRWAEGFTWAKRCLCGLVVGFIWFRIRF